LVNPADSSSGHKVNGRGCYCDTHNGCEIQPACYLKGTATGGWSWPCSFT